MVRTDSLTAGQLARTEATPGGEGAQPEQHRPAESAWTCVMNADVRHNSCAAPQHLYMQVAPEDGELVEPTGYTTIDTLQNAIDGCTAEQRQKLRASFPASLCAAGWHVVPVGNYERGHRRQYVFKGPHAPKEEEQRAHLICAWRAAEDAP